MSNGDRTRSTGKKNAFTTRAFEEFFRLTADRLKAVKDGLSDAEIPSPPEPKKRRTPVPPAIVQQEIPPLGGI